MPSIRAPSSSRSDISPVRLLVKALLLFIAANCAIVLIAPETVLRLSVYNRLVPGLLRFPYVQVPNLPVADPDNIFRFVDISNLEVLYATHVISASAKRPDEFRVVFLGDSSVWGALLPPGQIISEQLNHLGLQVCGGRHVSAFDLGYPGDSALKDLVILSEVPRYSPDMIFWFVTLNSLLRQNQWGPPPVAGNLARAQQLILKYHLTLKEGATRPEDPAIWNRTLIGARRDFAAWARLQLLGLVMGGSGAEDQASDRPFRPVQTDKLHPDSAYYDFEPPSLPVDQLEIEVLSAGEQEAADVPLWLINEPIYISGKRYSSIRYNAIYPRWAYDQYRSLMQESGALHGWNYADLWDFIPGEQFTDHPLHITGLAEGQMAQSIAGDILASACKK